jgi:hypothetical protein
MHGRPQFCSVPFVSRCVGPITHAHQAHTGRHRCASTAPAPPAHLERAKRLQRGQHAAAARAKDHKVPVDCLEAAQGREVRDAAVVPDDERAADTRCGADAGGGVGQVDQLDLRGGAHLPCVAGASARGGVGAAAAWRGATLQGRSLAVRASAWGVGAEVGAWRGVPARRLGTRSLGSFQQAPTPCRGGGPRPAACQVAVRGVQPPGARGRPWDDAWRRVWPSRARPRHEAAGRRADAGPTAILGMGGIWVRSSRMLVGAVAPCASTSGREPPGAGEERPEGVGEGGLVLASGVRAARRGGHGTAHAARARRGMLGRCWRG